MAASKSGSFRHGSFADSSKERLLPSQKSYSDFGLNRSDSSFTTIKCQCFRSFSNKIVNLWKGLLDAGDRLWDMGQTDPRKVIFAAKMGLSLALVSLVIFLKVPLQDMSQYSIWAILTVVVVFEFTVGITSARKNGMMKSAFTTSLVHL